MFQRQFVVTVWSGASKKCWQMGGQSKEAVSKFLHETYDRVIVQEVVKGIGYYHGRQSNKS